MANFSDEASAETRCKAQMVAGTWIVAHVARDFSGTIICRFQRPMSPTSPDAGGWVTTDQDNVD